jgi:uncharacterized protein (DUF952 family)
MTLVFKIVSADEWQRVECAGVYAGSAKDRADGFLHFSKMEQLEGTLAKYYAGERDLLLVAVDGDALGAGLKFETSRDGQLFPHLYGNLAIGAVRWVRPIAIDAHGAFIVPF